MRTPNLGTAIYNPGDPPADLVQLQRYLREHNAMLAAALAALAAGHIDKVNVAPAKPRDGDLRYADGTNWNPGGGKGLYMHNGAVWTLVQAIP
jgi:hypothetical protein